MRSTSPPAALRARIVKSVAILVLAGGASGAAGPVPSAAGSDAPLLRVDRFSDAAATLLKRSRVPGLPGPGEPIHLDDPPFLVDLTGPGGDKERCYDLDVRPATPARLYVFYDRVGNYVLGQWPVVDVAPGDPGYTDIWDVWKVTVPDRFEETNWIRDLATVERLLKDRDSAYAAARSGALVNGPIVPEGSSADKKADRREGAAVLRYLWYKGKRAPYLYFEQSLRPDGERAPTSTLIFDSPAAGKSPKDPLAIPLGAGLRLRVEAVPGQPAYSPLHGMRDGKGRPLLEGTLNCPIVGP
ncbi:MAG TPA: hypothetical protein VKF61_05300 [Candidatus Polarisedimenticolia bacterium]|nr:hypothetical protein [Candidatus Polarisedimenticolia bacterium]